MGSHKTATKSKEFENCYLWNKKNYTQNFTSSKESEWLQYPQHWRHLEHKSSLLAASLFYKFFFCRSKQVKKKNIKNRNKRENSRSVLRQVKMNTDLYRTGHAYLTYSTMKWQWELMGMKQFFALQEIVDILPH